MKQLVVHNADLLSLHYLITFNASIVYSNSTNNYNFLILIIMTIMQVYAVVTNIKTISILFQYFADYVTFIRILSIFDSENSMRTAFISTGINIPSVCAINLLTDNDLLKLATISSPLLDNKF